MTDREKLIEILHQVSGNCLPCVTEELHLELLATALIANGVIVPPVKIGTHLWRVTYPYRKEPKVTEYVLKNILTTGKKHKIMLEVSVPGVPGTNIMHISSFKRTREEAEKELAEVLEKEYEV